MHRPPFGFWTSNTEARYMGRTAVAWGQSQHTIWPPTLSPSYSVGLASKFNINISRGATARAKRIPAGPHTRSSDLRDDAVGRTEQCGDASVLRLERKVAHPKWHGQSRWISQCVQQQPTANLVDFPLRIVRQLRYEFVCSMHSSWNCIEQYKLVSQ